MNRRVLFIAALALMLPGAPTVVAQQGSRVHRVALIDMGYVFKNYRKFDAMTASLRAEVEQADQASQVQLEQMQQVQARLNSGALLAGSPEQLRLEQQLIQMQTELQARRQVAEREFLRKEADIYKTVYLEVQDALQLYARHYGYTLILRFTRPDLGSAAAPREILDQLNNPVIYFVARDDVSDAVVAYLNDNWNKHNRSVVPAKGTAAP